MLTFNSFSKQSSFFSEFIPSISFRICVKFRSVEIVEKAKEGYESDVPELRDENKPKRNVSFESSLKEFDRYFSRPLQFPIRFILFCHSEATVYDTRFIQSCSVFPFASCYK